MSDVTPAPLPGPVLGRLAKKSPGLWDDLRALLPTVVPARHLQAVYLETACLRIRQKLSRLRGQGLNRLHLGRIDAVVETLALGGAFEGFVLERLTPNAPADDLPVHLPGFGPVPLVTTADAAASGPCALLAPVDFPGGGLPLQSAKPPIVIDYDAGEQAVKRGYVDQAHRLSNQAFFEARGAQTHAALARLAADGGVVFAGVYAYFNFSRLSLALRQRGIPTAFLCLNPSNAAHKEQHFDLLADAGGDAELFFELLTGHDFRCVHMQGWLGLHAFAAAAADLLHGRCLVELNDIPEFIFDKEVFDRIFSPGRFEAEARCLRHILSQAKVTAFNSTREALTLLGLADHSGNRRMFLHSHPYAPFFRTPSAPWPSQPIRLAFAGTIAPSSAPDAISADIKFLPLIRRLTAQGLACAFYVNPYQRLEAQGPFADHVDEAFRQPLFTIQNGLPPPAINDELAKAHFGLMLYDFSRGCEVKAEHLRVMLPSKFFGYLEAGLPVLVSPELEAVAALVRSHGLGLVVAAGELDSLAARLAGVDLPTLRANVAAFREQQGLHHRLGELLSAYELACGKTAPASS